MQALVSLKSWLTYLSFSIYIHVVLCFYRDTPVFCALINGEGEVVDFLRLPNFLKRRNAWREEEREKKVKHGWMTTSFIVGRLKYLCAIQQYHASTASRH